MRVDGHTDASGKDAYNDQLSVRRAKSVAKVLNTVGMQPENIQLRGLGSSVPLSTNNTLQWPHGESPGRHRRQLRLIGKKHLPAFAHQQALILLGDLADVIPQ
ncbi:UNVERIFIED_ORG: outer membrane protein OmpA-like peptidoglycan-associated protein [Pseudomonas reinekei]|nr:outer membrane protein OmpA-like peptidoglycan-associated protein [Pseudomonas reinekei]